MWMGPETEFGKATGKRGGEERTGTTKRKRKSKKTRERKREKSTERKKKKKDHTESINSRKPSSEKDQCEKQPKIRKSAPSISFTHHRTKLTQKD